MTRERAFLSIRSAPNTASSKSKACGGTRPPAVRLVVFPEGLPVAVERCRPAVTDLPVLDREVLLVLPSAVEYLLRLPFRLRVQVDEDESAGTVEGDGKQSVVGPIEASRLCEGAGGHQAAVVDRVTPAMIRAVDPIRTQFSVGF